MARCPYTERTRWSVDLTRSGRLGVIGTLAILIIAGREADCISAGKKAAGKAVCLRTAIASARRPKCYGKFGGVVTGIAGRILAR